MATPTKFTLPREQVTTGKLQVAFHAQQATTSSLWMMDLRGRRRECPQMSRRSESPAAAAIPGGTTIALREVAEDAPGQDIH